MNDDPDRMIVWGNGNGLGDYSRDRLWGLNDFTADEEPPAAQFAGGLASLGFITAALKRRIRLLCVFAAVGLLIGCGLYLKSPPGYQASTSLLLTPGPYENVQTASTNDQAMAQSASVAGAAVRKLGLQQSASGFLSTYKVLPVTERVITITISARSSNQAVLNARAVAAAFLDFRAREMQSEQNLVLAALNQQVNQARQRLKSINAQISQLSGTSGQQSELKNLQAEYNQANSNLYQVRQAALDNQTANGAATDAAIKGSLVMDAAAPLAHSRFKKLILDAALGLILGLVLGVGIVVIQALVSDKLRRRDDVAQALGAPVRFSVGAIGRRRWLPGRGASGVQDAEVQRIADHLRRAVPGSSRGPAALAVVPVDDVQVPASSLVSLALSCAREGQQVVVVDLCDGTPAARLVGAQEPGIREVSVHDTRLMVAVPGPDDVLPVGPLHRGSVLAQRTSFTDAVAATSASANLLLTLITLDPSLGGDHLATWATDAVAVVTAGRSSWTRVHGVAELIRLSGTRLVSAVLVGADKTDETIGTMLTPETV